jgi:hypothetical protein
MHSYGGTSRRGTISAFALESIYLNKIHALQAFASMSATVQGASCRLALHSGTEQSHRFSITLRLNVNFCVNFWSESLSAKQ